MRRLNFEDIIALRLGDVFYEKTGAEITVYKVSKMPTVFDNSGSQSVSWEGRDESGEEIEFFLTQGLERYGPEILD